MLSDLEQKGADARTIQHEYGGVIRQVGGRRNIHKKHLLQRVRKLQSKTP